MKSKYRLSALLGSFTILLLALGCSSTQSLQEYYVDNAENPNFRSLDVPANILKLDQMNLSEQEQKALGSFRKLNILAFMKTTENEAAFQEESAKVKAILKQPAYKELMKLNSKYGKGVIKYLGEGDAIDEVIIYGNSSENGFALIRVLGRDMNPAYIVQLMQSIESSDLKGEGFSELTGLLKG
ncbi:DUF4252 domain-containing protein [Robiginitalea sp. IMCC43444]|uniref:DUF4252 domain-containing protein n=1 Tax=Robiginitalea sp. IMCC43444 TaxID=3459121 RepID=UPI0040418EC8